VKIDGVFLKSVGVYLPPTVTTAEAIADGRYTKELFDLAGWAATHVAGDIPALDLAVRAARRALNRCEDVTVQSLVNASGSYHGPDGISAPGYLLRELGIKNATGVDIGQGCNGSLSAIEVGIGFLTGASNHKTTLITSGANFSSPMIDRWQGFGPTVIMGDGGSAAVLSTEDGFAAIRSLNSGILPELEMWHRGAESLLPRPDLSVAPLDLAARTHHFIEQVMPLTEAMDQVRRFSTDLVLRSLADAGIKGPEVSLAITANADLAGLDDWFAELELPVPAEYLDFARTVGHTAACDQIITLDHFLDTDYLSPGDHFLMLSFGPGWSTTVLVGQMLARPGRAG
jgi:3-oxoacyl-[acyl-carrier-protein] synthase-3